MRKLYNAFSRVDVDPSSSSQVAGKCVESVDGVDGPEGVDGSESVGPPSCPDSSCLA